MNTDAYSPLLALFSLCPDLKRADGRALTIYIPARSEGYDARYYDIVFGDLLHRYRERLGAADLAVMGAELPRLRAHLGEVRPAGTAAIACFAEEPSGLLEMVKLPLRTEERLEVGELLLAPALRQIEQLPPGLVVVVDEEHARTFAFILDDVRQLSAETKRQADLPRKLAGEVERAMASGAFKDLYVAGPPSARAAFERTLPDALRRKSRHLGGVSPGSPRLQSDLRERLSELRARSLLA